MLTVVLVDGVVVDVDGVVVDVDGVLNRHAHNTRDAKCQFSSVLLCFGLFRNSEIRLINAILTVVLVDGVVVDVDGV